MKTIKSSLLFLLFLTLPLYANQIDLQTQQKIQRILNNWRASSGIPAAMLSISLPNQRQRVTFYSGVTSYARNAKPNPNTLFQAGSITKSFTSTIILKLEAEGKLNINDPITKYLPQYPWWRYVTIRQLLNHTSGIFNYTETAAFNHIHQKKPLRDFTLHELVQLAANHRSYFAPGQGWKYSNTNYVLAGMIIEKVTKQPAEKVMNYYLRSKYELNLANTFYHARMYTSAFLNRLAHGYSSEGRDVTYGNMSWANTAGAIVTTTEDLLAWWQGLFQYKILSPQQLMKMTSLVCEESSHGCRAGRSMPHLYNDEVGKGYGLGIIQSSFGSHRVGTVWWHNGSTKGYKAIVLWYPKNNIYIALTINRDPGYLLKPTLPVIQRIISTII